MKTHAIAFAVLLASCATPRAERAEGPELVPDEPSDEAETRATCTHERPCTLDVVEIARRRAAFEADNEAKIAKANENPQTKRVAEGWMQTLAKSIADERSRFSEWCDLAREWSDAKRRAEGRGLTPKDFLEWTGPPTDERRPESRDDTMEGRVYTWDVVGPLSRSIAFGILFVRPAGTSEPMVFSGCQWCAEGGPVTSPGCVFLP